MLVLHVLPRPDQDGVPRCRGIHSRLDGHVVPAAVTLHPPGGRTGRRGNNEGSCQQGQQNKDGGEGLKLGSYQDPHFLSEHGLEPVQGWLLLGQRLAGEGLELDEEPKVLVVVVVQDALGDDFGIRGTPVVPRQVHPRQRTAPVVAPDVPITALLDMATMGGQEGTGVEKNGTTIPIHDAVLHEHMGTGCDIPVPGCHPIRSFFHAMCNWLW